jgi:hypothetical protein
MFSIKVCIKTLVLLFFFFIANSGLAQEIEWQNTIGGSLSDLLTSIRNTPDDGYILGGCSMSNISGDKTENSYGGNDYWVVKIDSSGNIQWQKTIGGNNTDMLKSTQTTLDGGYILGGYSISDISGSKSENSLGGNDFWILKIDSIGNIQWQNTIGGSGDDYLYSIQQTTDGGFFICGYSFSNASGDKSENCLGQRDYWVVKTDSFGNIEWENTIGGSLDDILYSSQQTTDGGYILGGFSDSNISGDKTENSLGGSDYWIVKIDANGNIQWQNTIGGSLSDILTSIRNTTDDGYILGGYSMSDISGDKTENSYGGNDYWVVKIDSVGNIQWQNTIGGSGTDFLNMIEQCSDGGFVVAGDSYSGLSGEKEEDLIGSRDWWVVKTDSVGQIEWQNSIGGNSSNGLSFAQPSNYGGYILGGFSNSDFSGDKHENCIGMYDYWVVKLTNKYNRIAGHLFADFNSNAIQDTLEPSLPNKMVIEQNSGRITFSDQNGKYSLAVLDSGSFLTYPTPLNLYSSSPATHTTYFSGIHQLDSLNDFAFQPQGAYDEVAVTITPLSGFRSGFNAGFMINYNNVGTTTVIPSIVFNPDNNILYQSASVTPNQITTDSVVWVLPSISPFQTGSIIVNVKVDLGLAIGSPLTSSVHIDPYNSDVNQSNNNANWEVFTIGSFDPNDILVSNDTLTTSQLNSSPWLDYIVRFQNTGNDTAFTVKILNPIDTNKLNISTIEFVNSSHPVNLNWINYQRNMEFKFDNILLPDSNVNEPLSHGFVHYRIKPKPNLVVGDTIKNFAAIYFDFNEPVITNTAQTVIVSPTGLSSLSSLEKLAVYPNPAQSKININGIKLDNGKAQLRLFDLYGKLIFEKNITTSTPEVDVKYLPAGMYLLQSGNQRATFVKQ